MKVGIKIMPRDVILDTQGRAVESSMKSNGFELLSCRVGKYVEVTVASENKAEAQSQVEKMLKEGGLYNPLIEKFEIQIN
ncbi:MAG: phosphoribosylformylglycinamidine synthase subunit PurS [Bdellovibrionaceae bacterium]|nr:phosphoribosylformylglycinamidine synthase subunit PurS [Bdellovibrio sp.]